MTANVGVETYPIGIRGYSIVPRAAAEHRLVTEKGRPDVWRVQPSGMRCEIFLATEAEAQECLRGVVEGLR